VVFRRIDGLAIWLSVCNSGVKMTTKKEWAGAAADGTICGGAVYQKLDRNGPPKFARRVRRGVLDLAGAGKLGPKRPFCAKRESCAKRRVLDRRLWRKAFCLEHTTFEDADEE
jgi:hypothetical protein